MPAGAIHAWPPNNGIGPKTNNNGRHLIDWPPTVWDQIDRAVHEEVTKAGIFNSVLRIVPADAKATSVPFDSITPPSEQVPGYSVDEGATVPIVQLSSPFVLQRSKLEQENIDTVESGYSTAVMLARRAATALVRGMDEVVAQGANGLLTGLFTGAAPAVQYRNPPPDTGLFCQPAAANAPGPPQPRGPALYQEPVFSVNADVPGQYGAGTFTAVANAVSRLAALGYTEPYYFVTDEVTFADMYRPVAGTLAVTADVVAPLVRGGMRGMIGLPTGVGSGYFNSGTASYSGIVGSLAPGTPDLVIALNATTVYVQQLPSQDYLFQVVMRFITRVTATEAMVLVAFE
jgi:uncharacterized linocin/CFP29 family protein